MIPRTAGCHHIETSLKLNYIFDDFLLVDSFMLWVTLARENEKEVACLLFTISSSPSVLLLGLLPCQSPTNVISKVIMGEGSSGMCFWDPRFSLSIRENKS